MVRLSQRPDGAPGDRSVARSIPFIDTLVIGAAIRNTAAAFIRQLPGVGARVFLVRRRIGPHAKRRITSQRTAIATGIFDARLLNPSF
jgi:hypothetical protein